MYIALLYLFALLFQLSTTSCTRKPLPVFQITPEQGVDLPLDLTTSRTIQQEPKESTGLIQLNTNYHMFRHASELKKESKGGFISGSLVLPVEAKNNDFHFSIEIIGASPEKIDTHLLHIMNPNLQEKPFLASNWRLNFLKDKNGHLYYIANSNGKPMFKLGSVYDNSVKLGSDGVRINVVTPKQDPSKSPSDITIYQVCASRYGKQADEALKHFKDVSDSLRNTIRLKLSWAGGITTQSDPIYNSRHPSTSPINIEKVHPWRCCDKGMHSNVYFHHGVSLMNLKFKLITSPNIPINSEVKILPISNTDPDDQYSKKKLPHKFKGNNANFSILVPAQKKADIDQIKKRKCTGRLGSL